MDSEDVLWVFVSNRTSSIQRVSGELCITSPSRSRQMHLDCWIRVFANGPGDLGSIPSCVIPKMVLDTSLLNTQQYKVLSRVKWSNPGKGVAPSPTPRCCSYWKGSLLVALDSGYQLLPKYCKTLIHASTNIFLNKIVVKLDF